MHRGSWRHRLAFGRGLVSDDTEHSFLLTRAILVEPHDPTAFAKRLARAFRWWLLALPPGVGFATLRAIVKLWLGFPPGRSGVASAGNGASMRIAPIGVRFHRDEKRLCSFVEAATAITHRDERALTGALAMARVAAWVTRESRQPSIEELLALLGRCGRDSEWKAIVSAIREAADVGEPVAAFADRLGLSRAVSGYVYHSVPIALYAWFHNYADFAKTLTSVLDCGGDTDTTGAMAGALAGLTSGVESIPSDWVRGVVDFPLSRKILTRSAEDLARATIQDSSTSPATWHWPAVPVRNFVLLLLVLAHGFRRLLPPY